MKNCRPTLLLFCLALVAPGVFAHHSSAPHFDHENPISVEGYFTEIKFVNPHAYIYFDEIKDGESVGWRCELSSATQLGRWGWSADMFSPGQKLVVSGSPARREDNVCFMSSIELADGTTISRNSDLTQMQDVMASNARPVESEEVVEREMFLADGRSNIEGAWVTKSFGRGAIGIRPEYVATAAGEAAVNGYTMAYDDPILRCHPVNIFNAWNHDENVNEIRIEGDKIILQYGFMDFVRTIHMDMDSHPQNLVASTGGHSIGWWENETLVVDTVGFEEGVLNHQNGMKHSDQMHSVERFYIDPETGYLNRDYTITDPLYLVGETMGRDMMAASATPYQTYNCVELSGDNNIRPEDRDL